MLEMLEFHETKEVVPAHDCSVLALIECQVVDGDKHRTVGGHYWDVVYYIGNEFQGYSKRYIEKWAMLPEVSEDE